jgi:DNA-binding Lrp family transcriptional regulator
MSKPNGYIRIDRALWRSPEVANLSPLAKLILLELHYSFTGKNNGELRLSYRAVVERYRCSKTTVVRSFSELHQAGLIKITVSGSFDDKAGARKGTCNQYRLTHLA